ncbi:uncharacterized protein LOC129579356 [Sitodiplosis mosellana]|uniref:uncharacterized protein LOC129579356 n=1 Tax=Sitodiplosis mosellana TaxID=263140 RepID=UPI0024449A03|nr:uncharacterized protein LOC129579356 [Sitodiplosis mosellana]
MDFRSEAKLGVFIVLLMCASAQPFTIDNKPLEQRTSFIFYDQNNRETSNTKCYETKKYSMIVPGFTESCETFWVRDLRQNLLNNREGCVICMDYSDYNKDYPFLIAHFKSVAKVLTDKLMELRVKGFRHSDAYLFGFSYGARLIVRAGNDIGPRQLGIIHLCDPAGPGFSNNADPRTAAQYSQCIHTNSKGRGTEERNCDQNWMMGYCGEWQPASGPKPLGSHGLCPVMYNNSFKYKFMAIEKRRTCSAPANPRDLSILPSDGIRMGYFQKLYNSTLLTGINLYAITKKNPPYC